MYASHWVYETQRRSESKGLFGRLRGDPSRAQPRRFHLSSYNGSSKSIHVGTRKMVNYAWPG